VNVQVGDQVNSGDILAALELNSLSQNVILAQADLYSAQQALEDLQNYEMQSALALQELEDAQENLEDLLNPDVALAQAQAQVSLLAAQDALGRWRLRV
jgi:multidrug efflux pump subunit AcrA (membrane-fusion protein)